MASTRRWILAALVASGVASGVACHGADSSDGHPGGGPVPEARRSDILDAIDAKYTELAAVDPTTAPAGVVAFAKTFGEVATSHATDDGMVWTTFTDGPIHVVGRNHDDGDTTSARVIPAAPRAPVDTTEGWRTETFPTGTQYVLLRALDGSWGSAPDAVDKALTNVGYVKKSLTFTATALKAPDALKNVGLLYMSTHGAASTGILVGGAVGASATLWTSERYDKTLSDTIYKDDLANGRMTTFSTNPVADDGRLERRYAITPAFVTTYLKPDGNLVVYADACESAAGLTGAKPFAQSFFQVGAADYLGWTASVNWHDSDRVLASVFDSVLGQPVSPTPPNPPTRPFPVELVFRVNAYTGKGATLIDVTPSGSTEDTDLAPSITNMTFDPNDTSLLRINGRFGFSTTAPSGDAGTDAGVDVSGVTVTVGGITTGVVGVTNGALVVKLPNDGLGSAGDVVVTVHGIRSNAAPLTDWHGKVHFTDNGISVAGTAGYCKYTFDWTLHLRGDIHTFSYAPREPQVPSGFVVPSPSSSMTYLISGTGTDSTGATFVCAGSGLPAFSTSPILPAGDDFATLFNWFGQISPAPPALLPDLLVSGVVTHVRGTISSGSGSGAIDVQVFPIPWPSKLALDTDGSIKAGSSGSTGQLTWTAMPAGSAPTPKTPQ